MLKGWAGEALLETYSAERVPVAKQIVLCANKSSPEFGGFFDALGVTTGIAGQAWADAAAAVADKLGIPLKAVVIGPGQEVTDLYFDWARLREIEEDGALLVRPDKIVAWRRLTMVDDPDAALLDSLQKMLSKV